MDKGKLVRRIVLMLVVVLGMVGSVMFAGFGLLIYELIPQWRRDEPGMLLLAGGMIVAGVLVAIGCVVAVRQEVLLTRKEEVGQGTEEKRGV
jgi:hypothetical protein